MQYLPNYQTNKLPAIANTAFSNNSSSEINERDLLYKVLFEMKKEMNDLKQIVHNMMKGNGSALTNVENNDLQAMERIYNSNDAFPVVSTTGDVTIHNPIVIKDTNTNYSQPIVVEESLSLQDKEIDMIKKALKKHKGKRKYASQELGISERTLYRKINEYNIVE